MKMKLNIAPINPHQYPQHPAPKRGSPGAAGFDLYSTDPIDLPPGERVVVGTGWRWAIPHGCYGQIAPRSGIAVSHGIDVLAGIVDEDYRGEVRVVLINTGEESFHAQRGERIAQMLILPCYTGTVRLAIDDWSLPMTERGEGGFGSTGM